MSMTDFRPGNSMAIPTRVNTGVIPRFRVEKQRVPDEFDPETGLPRYRTIEVMDLLIPGDLKSSPAKRVNDAIRSQYAAEYQAWKKAGEVNEALAGTGLPLTHWPQIPSEIAAGLAHANIFTVEQLAGLSDTQTQIRGTIGLRKYRDMAAAFVDRSSAAAPIAALESKNQALENQIALLTKQMEQVNARAEAALKKAAGEEETPDLSTPRDAKKGNR